MLNLEKGVPINLDKTVTEEKMKFDIGWTGKNGKSLDLDTYIAVIDKDNVVLDFIYFGNLNGEGVDHKGDDLDGGATKSGINETIVIKTKKLNPKAVKLAVGLFIYSGAKNLSKVDYAFAQLRDSNGNVVVKYDLAQEFGESQSVEIAEIVYSAGSWSIKAIGEASQLDFDGVRKKYKVGKSIGSTSGGGGLFGRIFG